jgi:hypothetical protein
MIPYYLGSRSRIVSGDEAGAKYFYLLRINPSHILRSKPDFDFSPVYDAAKRRWCWFVRVRPSFFLPISVLFRFTEASITLSHPLGRGRDEAAAFH